LLRWSRQQFGFAADAWLASDGLWFIRWSPAYTCSASDSIQSVAMARAIEAHRANQLREDAEFAARLERI